MLQINLLTNLKCESQFLHANSFSEGHLFFKENYVFLRLSKSEEQYFIFKTNPNFLFGKNIKKKSILNSK